jgi:hypothetical protein
MRGEMGNAKWQTRQFRKRGTQLDAAKTIHLAQKGTKETKERERVALDAFVPFVGFC